VGSACAFPRSPCSPARHSTDCRNNRSSSVVQARTEQGETGPMRRRRRRTGCPGKRPHRCDRRSPSSSHKDRHGSGEGPARRYAKAPNVPVISTKATNGRSKGRVMCRNSARRPEPSRRAALVERGIDALQGSQEDHNGSTDALPGSHDGKVQGHPGGAQRPDHRWLAKISRSRLSNAPVVGSMKASHIRAMIASETTVGRYQRVR